MRFGWALTLSAKYSQQLHAIGNIERGASQPEPREVGARSIEFERQLAFQARDSGSIPRWLPIISAQDGGSYLFYV